MQDQLKFKIIKGRGEEEEVEIKSKKEFKTPLKLISKKPEDVNTTKKKEPLIKKSFKITKRHLKFLFAFFAIIILFSSFYFIFKNKNLIFKNLQFSFFPKFEKQQRESPLQPTSSEALLLLLQKLQTMKAKEEATSTTPTSPITTPTIEVATKIATPTEISTPTSQTATKTEIVTKPATPTSQMATKTEEAVPLKIAKTEKIEPSSPKIEEIKEIKKEEIPVQKTKEGIIFPNLSSIKINLTELNEEGFKKAWLDSLKIQKEAGSIYEIEFLYNNSKVINDIIKDYFIKPSFIEKKHSEEFKKTLTDYKILFYYTYTRKFPILIFNVNNDSFAVTFMRLWDKETLLKDVYNLYLGLPKGKLIRNFTITEEYSGIKYKIAYYDNDYKFIWTIYNNYLIFSTSLNAFKYVINLLK